MKRARYRLLLLSISLVLVFTGFVFVSGCLSSAIGRGDMTITRDEPAQAPPAFPLMYNYPKDTQVLAADSNMGKFSAGDVIQPDKNSPVFDPDVAVVIVRDTGDGLYEVGSVSRSAGTWNRTPLRATGNARYADIERLFPEKVGHLDSASLYSGLGK